jgi:hypothetical protein
LIPEEVISGVERRRRVRSLTLRLALFAVVVYIVFIIVFVNQGR